MYIEEVYFSLIIIIIIIIMCSNHYMYLFFIYFYMYYKIFYFQCSRKKNLFSYSFHMTYFFVLLFNF